MTWKLKQKAAGKPPAGLVSWMWLIHLSEDLGQKPDERISLSESPWAWLNQQTTNMMIPQKMGGWNNRLEKSKICKKYVILSWLAFELKPPLLSGLSQVQAHLSNLVFVDRGRRTVPSGFFNRKNTAVAVVAGSKLMVFEASWKLKRENGGKNYLRWFFWSRNHLIIFILDSGDQLCFGFQSPQWWLLWDSAEATWWASPRLSSVPSNRDLSLMKKSFGLRGYPKRRVEETWRNLKKQGYPNKTYNKTTLNHQASARQFKTTDLPPPVGPTIMVECLVKNSKKD